MFFFWLNFFLLASCAFCFHWSLVFGDHYVIGRLCLWLVSNFRFSNSKTAGAVNMDDCQWANVSSWKPCLYTWWFWPRSHETLCCKKQQKSLSDMVNIGNFGKIWQGNVLIQKYAFCMTLSVPDWLRIEYYESAHNRSLNFLNPAWFTYVEKNSLNDPTHSFNCFEIRFMGKGALTGQHNIVLRWNWYRYYSLQITDEYVMKM